MHHPWRLAKLLVIAALMAGVFSIAAGPLTATAAAPTTTPATISFQGKIVNFSDGTNVADGNYSVTFKLYNALSGGSQVWGETQASVAVTGGVFQVNLGSTCSFFTTQTCSGFSNTAIDFSTGPSLYLTMKFAADSQETSPRIPLQSVPFAFNAETANKLGGLTASAFAQLNPGSAQSGSLNVTGNVQAAASVLTPLLDSISGALGIGTGATTAVNLGKSGVLTSANGGFTATAGAVSLNDNANFNTSINSGTSTGTVTIGSATNGNTVTIQNGAASNIVVGTTGTTVLGTLTLSKTSTATSGGNALITSTITANPASAPATPTSFVGVNGKSQASGTNLNANITITGVYGAAINASTTTLTLANGVAGQIFSGNNITTANALSASIFNNGTGTFTNGNGLYIQTPSFGSTGLVTTSNGIYIQDQKVAGVTTGYGINQIGLSDLNIFNGATTFGAAGTAVTVTNNASVGGTINGLTLTSTTLSAAGALTVSTGGAGQLTLGTGSTGILGLATSVTTLQTTAAALTLDLNNAGSATFTLKNSGAGVANLNLFGGSLQTGSTPTTRLDNAGNLLNIGTITASGLQTLSLTGGNALAVTGFPVATATLSLVRLGNAIVGGNATAGTGGTYIGINVPSSGAGSTADFLNFQDTGTTVFKIDGTGNVNTTGVYQKGGVSGTTVAACTAAQYIGNGVTVSGGIITAGTCHADGVSDQRLKQNIASINGGLDLLNQLQPVSYEFNDLYHQVSNDDHDYGTQYGFVAQQVAQVAPGLVSDFYGIGGYYGIDYHAFFGLLTAAVQDLSHKVDNLQVGQVTNISLANDQQFQINSSAGKIATIDAQGNATFSSSIISPRFTASGALTIDSGSAGDISIDTGSTSAYVNVGTSRAQGVNVSQAGQTTTVAGALVIDQAATFHGTVTVDNADITTKGSFISRGGTLQMLDAGGNGLFTIDATGNGVLAGNLNLTSASVSGGLSVGGDLNVAGLSTFQKLATFIAKTVFRQDVEFDGHITVAADTAGYASLRNGETKVHVAFKNPYTAAPIVSANTVDGQFVQTAVSNVTADGFDISVALPVTQDTKFSWTALAVKDAQTATNSTPTTP